MKICVIALMFLLLLPAPGSGTAYQPVENTPIQRPVEKMVNRSAAPKTPAASRTRVYVSPSGKKQLFGTVAMGKPLESLPIWLDVITRNGKEPIFQPERYFNKKTSWEELRSRAAGKNLLEQLRIVNSFWNGWPYREDRVNWGKSDYWAIPAQFLKKSGDCEDYSIVKYFTLKELGVDPHSMRIVVLRDTIRNLVHAVLAVELDDDIYILDNLSNGVLSHKRLTNYLPQYSVNEFGRWAHIMPKGYRTN